MFALAKFYFVCPLDSVAKTNYGTFCVKFKDGTDCNVDIVTTHDSYDLLEKLKSSLYTHSPRIVLKRCDETVPIKLEQNGELNPLIQIKEEFLPENIFIGEEDYNKTPSTSKGLLQYSSEDFYHDHTYSNLHAIEDSDESSDWEIEEKFLHTTVNDMLTEFQDDLESVGAENNLQEKMDCVFDPETITTPDLKLFDERFIEENIGRMVEVSDTPYKEDVKLEDASTEIKESNTSFLEVPLEEAGTSSDKSKRNFCIYCKKLFTHLPRHLERMHQKAKEVEQICSYPKGSEERKLMTREMILTSNYVYNQNYSKGELLVARRPRRGASADTNKYIPCSGCKGFYAKGTIHKHYRVCKKEPEKRQSEIPLHDNACEILRNDIFPFLKESPPVKIIQKDTLAIAYGNYLCDKYKKPEYQVVKMYLRYTGKLLLAAKKIDPSVNDLESLMVPSSVKTVVQAINNVAGLKNGKYKSPSTVGWLKRIFKDVIKVLKVDLYKNNDTDCLQADVFLNSLLQAFKKGKKVSSKEDRYIKKREAVSSREEEYIKKREAASRKEEEYIKKREAASRKEEEYIKKREAASRNEDEYIKKREAVSSKEDEGIKKREAVSIKEDEYIPTELAGPKKRRWNEATKESFFKLFENHLENRTLPSSTQCRMAMVKFPSLKSKTVAAVKTAVLNEIRRRDKGIQVNARR